MINKITTKETINKTVFIRYKGNIESDRQDLNIVNISFLNAC